MNKTKIPWADYAINPVRGLCPVGCPYCYARKLYRRYHWAEELSFKPEVFGPLAKVKAPSRVFVGSTMELFGEWVTDEQMRMILALTQDEAIRHHTFIFLTKRPENLSRWSPWPDNCWVGATVTDQKSYERALKGMSYMIAPVRFLSLEPLLSPVQFLGRDLDIFHWLIIGSQTKPVIHPRRGWVEEILQTADKVGIPVFVKEPLASYLGIHRQEFPR